MSGPALWQGGARGRHSVPGEGVDATTHHGGATSVGQRLWVWVCVCAWVGV